MSNAVPVGWRQYRIADVLRQEKVKFEMNDDESYPLLSVRRRNGGFFHRETLKGRQILTKTLTKAIPESFVISKMQVVHGACGVIEEPFYDGYLSASYVSFLSKDNRVHIPYFNYLCHTPLMYRLFLLSSHGVHIEKMTFDVNDWLKKKVVLPPFPEQQKVAAILSSVDEVIEKTRAQIDKLKDLKTGMMQELLTKGIGSGGVPHTEFKDSPVGRVPAHWNVVELREFCKLQNGYAFKSEDFSQTGTPLIRISNIKNYGIQVNHDVCISDPSIPDRFFVHAGDSLIAMSGATTGKTGCYRLKQKAVLNQRVGRFVPLTGKSDNRWIRHLVQTDWFTDAILIDAAGGAQPNISSFQIESILCALPPLDEQAQIAKSLDSVDIRREAEVSKLVSLTNLKRALMQDLLTGKIRVNPL